MPSFEEEAFARAQQMNRRTSYHNANQRQAQKPPESKEEPKQEIKEQSVSVPVKKPQNTGNLFDIVFSNKEQSLILLLIVLLMDEKADPTLLLALLYLLL